MRFGNSTNHSGAGVWTSRSIWRIAVIQFGERIAELVGQHSDGPRKWSRWSKAFYEMKRAAAPQILAGVRNLIMNWLCTQTIGNIV